MKRHHIVVVFLLSLLFVVSASTTLALPGIENQHCTRADGVELWVNYNYKEDLLAIRNGATGEVLFVVERFATDYINLKAFSANCRYLVGQVDSIYVIWDVANGGRAFVNQTIPFVYAPDIIWENTQYIAIGAWSPGRSNFYVWDVFNNRTLRLITDSPTCLMQDLTWDFEHREVWGRFQCNADLTGEIRGYSLVDGSLIGHYPSLLEQTDVEGWYKLTYEVSEDRQYITVSPFYSEYVMVYRRDGTLLGNLHTFHTYLPRHAISPDGRFYVIAQNQIRVWDFAQLNLDTSIPNFTWAGPDSVMLTVKFVDAVTIEVTLKDGSTQRWNILTGTQVL